MQCTLSFTECRVRPDMLSPLWLYPASHAATGTRPLHADGRCSGVCFCLTSCLLPLSCSCVDCVEAELCEGGRQLLRPSLLHRKTFSF